MIVQTPGVYIKEKSLLPNSVAGISTAVPAFIGFTKHVPRELPTGPRLVKRITSMFEFENLFGGAYQSSFDVDLAASPNPSLIADKRFFLYDSLNLYFRNGGGPCYIISAGSYDLITNPTDANAALGNQIIELDHLDEATIALMPDVHIQFNVGATQVGLAPSEYGALCSQMITKCAELKDKFALIDYHTPSTLALETRSLLTPTSNDIKYGAVYYPWLVNATKFGLSTDQVNLSGGSASTLKTSLAVVNADIAALEGAYNQNYDITGLVMSYRGKTDDVSTPVKLRNLFQWLYSIVKELDGTLALNDANIESYRASLELNASFTNEVKNLYWITRHLDDAGFLTAGTAPHFPLNGSYNAVIPDSNWIEDISGELTYGDLADQYGNLNYTFPTTGSPNEKNKKVIADLNSGQYVDLNIIFTAIAGLFDMAMSRKQMIETQLFATDADYIKANELVQNYMAQIPAQGAMAGIYCKNDRDRGVWKSPANIAVQGIVKPMVEVSNAQQDLLNVDADNGKSINVIRTFTGKGPLVWGARTLAGNSNEWRYISVRRFFSFAEESILKAMNPFVFEPNNARTWVKIKAMVTSFLAEQWKAGALVGASLDEAFFVRVGKDTTSETEILEGKINVQIGMAVARPAEFIILEFSHFTKA